MGASPIPTDMVWSESPVHAFFQARVTRIANDNMIEQIDIEQVTGLNQLFRHLKVLGRGCRIAAWMIVTDDHIGTVAHDRGPKDL
jgi:hypothetical protein